MSENVEQLEKSLIEVAVESWRLARLFAKLLGKLELDEAGRYASQLRYFEKRVNDSITATGLKLVSVEGQVFDPGMAVSALNISDFNPEELLAVDQMIEPIVMGAQGLKKQGTVLLRKVEQ